MGRPPRSEATAIRLPTIQPDGWMAKVHHVIDEHFGEAGAAGSGCTSGSSTSGSNASGRPRARHCSRRTRDVHRTRTPAATPARAIIERPVPSNAGSCTPAEQSQCRELQQQMLHGSLKGYVSIVATMGWLKGPVHWARSGSGSPVTDANTSAMVAFGDERRRCRNCGGLFFAAAAGDHGLATTLGVASFCTSDCLWSFSLRAEEDG